VDGKFLALGEARLRLRGVTYGTFSPDRNGQCFGSPHQVREDFAVMATAGINAVRTYTAPPVWLLDEALAHGLGVMAGLAWEQHVAFLDDRKLRRAIEAGVRAQAEGCAGHPALLCFAVGNEIPTPIVRWHGRRRVESFIERLCIAVRSADPDALLTYVNYPSTEYLRLPFLDFLAFNVYLDSGPNVDRYLARLQNLAGEKPLVLAELGVDSRRAGRRGQAESIGAQVEAAFASGCAGAFVFAWTDEWHRGEDAVLDWDFGLTTRERRPKPALTALSKSYRGLDSSRPAGESPLVSVVVCTHNGERWLRECLEAVAALRYPAFETIVVDDGSTDRTAEIASMFEVRVICTENRGLSDARNTGLESARGEYVAYIDDDTCPDRDWLHFLVTTFRTTDHAGVGGPNLPPRGEGAVACCVANAPGGPVHVLVSDTEAEHIPGCNMAYRRSALLAVGGFDPQFRAAGDDVDVCWRLQEQGFSLGFHPAAVVWHHRRSSVRAYWRQQRGYGHAEALLERKWPERYTRRGHLTWTGRLYDRATTRGFRPSRIYHGTWGTGAFQPEERPADGAIADALGSPDWYLVVAALAGLSALGLKWPLLLWVLPALLVAASASVGSAALAGLRADLGPSGRSRFGRMGLRGVTALLHLLQPAARLSGRLSHGLAPWRRRRTAGFAAPRRATCLAWHESWIEPRSRVERIEQAARGRGGRVVRGGPYARWDLELCGGLVGAARVLVAVEEHGRGRQLVRSRVWPSVAPGAWRALAIVVVLALAALVVHKPSLAVASLALGLGLCILAVWECGLATASALSAVEESVAAARVRRSERGRKSSEREPELRARWGTVTVGSEEV
jgi:GT2 family glycosyltransferase